MPRFIDRLVERLPIPLRRFVDHWVTGTHLPPALGRGKAEHGTGQSLTLLVFVVAQAASVVAAVQGKRTLDISLLHAIPLVICSLCVFGCAITMVRSVQPGDDGKEMRTFDFATIHFTKVIISWMLVISIATPALAYWGLLPGQPGPSLVQAYSWTHLPADSSRSPQGIQVVFAVTADTFGRDRMPGKAKVFVLLSEATREKWEVMTPFLYEGEPESQKSFDPTIRDQEPGYDPVWQSDYNPNAGVYDISEGFADSPPNMVEFSLTKLYPQANTLVLPLLARRNARIGARDRQQLITEIEHNNAIRVVFFPDES